LAGLQMIQSYEHINTIVSNVKFRHVQAGYGRATHY